MFGWCDENGGSKIFWFEETKGGNQKLVRPDGTTRIMKKKHRTYKFIADIFAWKAKRRPVRDEAPFVFSIR